ncbi:hypothetical protein E4U49_004461 [Claviceps purpurea]|nr:hypothetical protein E4U49_004461 [Claviceps purpurea]
MAHSPRLAVNERITKYVAIKVSTSNADRKEVDILSQMAQSTELKVQNDDQEVLYFGGFQEYSSGLKRTIRHRKKDLLATQGCATAALTLSPAEASRRPANLRAKHERLLGVIRGQQTPGQPQASKPFARESERIKNII